MSVPMKNGGMPVAKVIFYVVLSGITTGIGAFFGAIIGSISKMVKYRNVKNKRRWYLP